MPEAIQRRALGLVTDPSPATAPDGSLFQADNVWIRRPGMLEPRPGLAAETITALSVPSGYSIYQLFPFEGDIVAVATDGSGNWRVYSVTAGTTHTFYAAADTFTGTIGCVRAAQMAGNLYLTTNRGVMRITAPGTAATYRAGLERPSQTRPTRDDSATTSPNRPLAADSAIAYRYVARRKVGDRWIYSAPSGRVVQRCHSADSQAAARLETDGGLAVGPDLALLGDQLTTDEVEIYRSAAFTTSYTDEATDEMIHIGTIQSTASNAFPDYTDDAPTTSNIGAALYTNETQAGANQENGRPPMCRDIAEYNSMMFYGGAIWPATLTFSIGAMGDDWRGSATGKQERFTTFTITGTTSSNTTVSGVSAADIAKLHVGQRVFLDGGTPDVVDVRFAAGTLITAIGASSFTISAAALTSTVGFTIRVCDWIEFSGTNGSGTTTGRFYMHTSYGGSAGTFYVDANDYEASSGVLPGGAVGLAYWANAYFKSAAVPMNMRVTALGDGYYVPWTFLVEEIGLLNRASPATITVKTSNPRVTQPRIDSSTGMTNTARGGQHGYTCSKLGQPEHVPPFENYNEIGSNEHAIQRIIQGRDSLFIFKTDGVWRVSGYSPESLTVDEFDRSMTLIHPDAVCAYDGRIAAWTNKGVVLMGDAGYDVISAPIATTLAAYTNVSATSRGTWLAAWPYEDLLLLGTNSGTSVFAYHIRNQSWTKWTHATTAMHCAAQSANALYVGGIATSTATLLKSNSTTKDIEYAITVSNVSGTTITISGGSGWTPAVNDLVIQSSVAYAISAVTSATVFTVQAAGLTAAAATAEVGPTSTVIFVGEDAGDPLSQKNWTQAKWFFFVLRGVCRIVFSFLTDRHLSTTTANYFETFQSSNFTPKSLRVPVPRNSRKASGILPGFAIGGPRMAWLCSAMSMSFSGASARVGNDD
jgi:hypothetical protein